MKGPLLVAFVIVIILLAIWDGVWKLIALWKSARHDQLAWFICLAIFNTIGVLPILYLLFFQKTEAQNPAANP
jgi:predicted permease